MVLQWQDGEAKIVLPEAAAESEIIVPKPGW